MKRKQLVYNNDSDIYNKLLNDYELKYAKFSDEKEIKKHDQHKFKDLFLKKHNYNEWFDIKMIKNQMMKNQVMIKHQKVIHHPCNH